MNIKMNIENYFFGALCGIAIGMGGEVCADQYTGKLIPTDTIVQSGYVVPSKLEIRCKDLDRNGELETVMKIGDTQYLLQEINGQPVLSQYQIKPVPVVSKWIDRKFHLLTPH